MRGNELPLMTATPDVGSRLLACRRPPASARDRPSLPLVEQPAAEPLPADAHAGALRRELPQHRYDRASRKEIGLQTPAAASRLTPMPDHTEPISPSSASATRQPAAGLRSCSATRLPGHQPASAQPPSRRSPLPLKLAACCLSQIGRRSPALKSTPAPGLATACSSTTVWAW